MLEYFIGFYNANEIAKGLPLQPIFLLPPFLVDRSSCLLRLSKRIAHALQRDVHVAEKEGCIMVHIILLPQSAEPAARRSRDYLSLIRLLPLEKIK